MSYNGCDSLQSCLEQLFEEKDLISRNDYIQCLEKGGNKNTNKWSCEDCPKTYNFYVHLIKRILVKIK